MNDDEFAEWGKRHGAAFPGMREWAKERVDAMTAFRDCLRDVELADALEATRRLNCGDEPEPKGYGDHARAVRRIAGKIAGARAEVESQRKFEGQRAYDCPHCRDKGVVIIANIYATRGFAPLKRYLAGELTEIPECAIACNCRAAPRDAAVRFDPETMFPIRYNDRAERDAFATWWEEKRFIRRESAFDDWNRGT